MDRIDTAETLYLRVAGHYRRAIRSGALAAGDRLPSLRALTRLHGVSLSTVVQACHCLEDEGLLEARPRSGYFVRAARGSTLQPVREPDVGRPPSLPDPAVFAGIHARVSDFVAKCERFPTHTNLAQAFGPPEVYPLEALRNAAIRALRRHPEVLVNPVPPLGDAGFRSVLARRAVAAGMSPAPDEILVTHGCTEALNLALRAVAAPGDVIAVESPAYFGLLQVIESLGLRALEIPTSPSRGLSVEALELAIRTHPDLRAVVVVPNFQNPLGCVMPDGEKARLVDLCSGAGVALIEDDIYGALDDDDQSLKACKAWDRDGSVIHCASFHKTLAPGMRVGWMLGGRWLDRIRMLKHAQSRPNDALAQLAIGEFMAGSAYDRHLVRLRRHLLAQRTHMAEAIATHFPAGTRLNPPGGGMLLWVELPAGCDSMAVFDAALRSGIRVAPGAMFSNSGRFDHFLRICCGAAYSPSIEAALRTLARIVSAG
ncbi:MAG TPA: PLP-dependent aminotransferase family protein [Rhodocyclaceae bacterium]|nr:PLP-dependent aminotransferase family protein [Rhodocyclaceae bacterium]HNF61806.1 PLP-dependent aminotransferase family protein [Rhodocyclaceae bacterium]HNO86729.1 PLP-dependent aminotransferase family protein [Rhodocyclaceae bacterium]